MATVPDLTNGNGRLPARSIADLLRHVAGTCQSLVYSPRIAFSGPFYGIGHLGALVCFGHGIELAPVGNLATVFEEVGRGQADFGVAPLDNCGEGRLAETLGLLRPRPRPSRAAEQEVVQICRQIELPVRCALLAKCPRIDLREVYGTPAALSACRNWLAKHLPAARSVEVTSPASAGQLASERPGAAAVAAVEVGGPLGLGVLAEDIEDGGPHVVRLAIIGRRAPTRAHKRRTALVLELHNRPGALADVLTVFKREKLDLTRIESLPAAGMDRPCVLFLEVGGNQSGAAFRRAVAAVTKKTLRLDVLGSYANGALNAAGCTLKN
jgi:chorismate mutase/prephenate dehydratase